MIRRARQDDLEALVAGNLAMAHETERVRLDPEVLGAGVAALLEGRAPGAYWVAEEDGRVRGQLLITYEWSDWRNRTARPLSVHARVREASDSAAWHGAGRIA